MSKSIAVVTSSRADYSHLYWVLHALREHPALDLKLIAFAAHLSPEFGCSIDAIEADGFIVDERIECLLSSDTDTGMAKTIGIATQSLADTLGRMRPDLLLIIADRYEMLAPASVALALRIPIAHIEGGEISEGAIDDAVRNALTKMGHLHFTPTQMAKRRVCAMGEEPWRVHATGAPSLDHLKKSRLFDSEQLAEQLGSRVDPRSLLVAYHPVTLASDTILEADAVFRALGQVERPLVFCFPNADAGSRQIVERARRLVDANAAHRLFVNLPPVTYWSLLHQVSGMFGNSSSGIMEAPSLALPTVNVGFRQQGRERARNIIDCEPQTDAILAALAQADSQGFRESLAGMTNPYGSGDASDKIAQLLADAPDRDTLLHKIPQKVPDA